VISAGETEAAAKLLRTKRREGVSNNSIRRKEEYGRKEAVKKKATPQAH
jgi:hypothetical protein